MTPYHTENIICKNDTCNRITPIGFQYRQQYWLCSECASEAHKISEAELWNKACELKQPFWTENYNYYLWKNTKKICIKCGGERDAYTRKFCNKCSKKDYSVTKKCLYCGGISRNNYCSDSCRSKAYWKKLKARLN